MPSGDRPRLLDLFCGAGGAAMGYHRAGFDVVGVDINPQPHYPFEFHQADATTWRFFEGFDAVHASPPCHDLSSITPQPDGSGWMLADTIDRLRPLDIPWVVENVVGPNVRMDGWWFTLCGSMFDLRVRRHRRFGSNHLMLASACRHREQGTPLGVYGDGGAGKSTRPSGGGGTKARRQDFGALMDMPWATPAEIVQAIPPAYTEWIGRHLADAVDQRCDLLIQGSHVGVVGIGVGQCLAGEPQEAQLGFGDGEGVGHAGEYEVPALDVKS